MKRIPLTKRKHALVDNDLFDVLSQYKWHFNNRGYAVRQEYLGKVDGKYKQRTICMHRAIMNTPKGMDTDHINGDKLDNRKSNLRVCTRSQNQMNSLQSNKYTGVSLFTNKPRNWSRYSARIQVMGKSIFLGYFTTAVEAAKAYNTAATKYHGEYAKVNKV